MSTTLAAAVLALTNPGWEDAESLQDGIGNEMRSLHPEPMRAQPIPNFHLDDGPHQIQDFDGNSKRSSLHFVLDGLESGAGGSCFQASTTVRLLQPLFVEAHALTHLALGTDKGAFGNSLVSVHVQNTSFRGEQQRSYVCLSIGDKPALVH